VNVRLFWPVTWPVVFIITSQVTFEVVPFWGSLFSELYGKSINLPWGKLFSTWFGEEKESREVFQWSILKKLTRNETEVRQEFLSFCRFIFSFILLFYFRYMSLQVAVARGRWLRRHCGADPAGIKVFVREHPNSRKREHAISGTSIPKQWFTAENGRQGEVTIMVKASESTPFVRTLRSGNGRGKNIGNREEKVSTNCWISCSLIG